MGRTFTIAQLMDMAKEATDQENHSAISDTTWQDWISTAYAQLYDVLRKSGMRYFESELSLTAQTTALPADFLALRSVDYVYDAAGRRRELYCIMPGERNRFIAETGTDPVAYELVGSNVTVYPAASATKVCKLVYVPQPTKLNSPTATSTSVDVVTPDGEDFIVWSVALRARDKLEQDMMAARDRVALAKANLEEDAFLRELENPRRPVVRDDMLDGMGGRTPGGPLGWPPRW